MLRKALKKIISNRDRYDDNVQQTTSSYGLGAMPTSFENAEKNPPVWETTANERYNASSPNTQDRETTVCETWPGSLQNGETLAHGSTRHNRIENINAEDLKAYSHLYKNEASEISSANHFHSENLALGHRRMIREYEGSESSSKPIVTKLENSGHNQRRLGLENLEANSSVQHILSSARGGHLSVGLVNFLSKKVVDGIDDTYFDVDTVRYLRRLHKIVMEKDSALQPDTQYQLWGEVCRNSRSKLQQKGSSFLIPSTSPGPDVPLAIVIPAEYPGGKDLSPQSPARPAPESQAASLGGNFGEICNSLVALTLDQESGLEDLQKQLLLNTSYLIQQKSQQGQLLRRDLVLIIENSHERGHFAENITSSISAQERSRVITHGKEPVKFRINEEIDAIFFDDIDEITLDIRPNIKLYNNPMEEWAASVHLSIKQQVLKDIRAGRWVAADGLIDSLAHEFRFSTASETYPLFRGLPATWAILASYIKTRLRRWDLICFPVTEILDGLTDEFESPMSQDPDISADEKLWTLPAMEMRHKGRHWRHWMFLSWMIRAESEIFRYRDPHAAQRYWARGWFYLNKFETELKFRHLGYILEESQYLARIIEHHISDAENDFSFSRNPQFRYPDSLQSREKWYEDMTKPLHCTCCRGIPFIHSRVYPDQRHIALEFPEIMNMLWSRDKSRVFPLNRQDLSEVTIYSKDGRRVDVRPPSSFLAYEFGRMAQDAREFDPAEIWLSRQIHWG
ncbi:hypothetical protein TWF730_002327 [Orbilia blumenaviensis]|uniref:Uncharacterized protein n=1 Tax=Orbilia blumenaviensis TaxID=1796055 RepID=A0AAV9UAE8_9PEZI